MIARALVLLPMLLILSCGSTPPPPAKGPPPQPWTGTWTRLDGLAVPKGKKVTLNQSCTRSAEYWIIEQKGNSILLEYHPAELTADTRLTLVHRKIEKAKGERRKSFVRLDGQSGVEGLGPRGDEPQNRRLNGFPVTYELDWDPKTDHLAGTRNGSPVRFVRADLAPVDHAPCQPVP